VVPQRLSLDPGLAGNEELVVRILQLPVQEPADQHGVERPAAGREEGGDTLTQLWVSLTEETVELRHQSSSFTEADTGHDLHQEP